MTILKPGKTKDGILYKGKCPYDDCLFVFSEEESLAETSNISLNYENWNDCFRCPTCGALIEGKKMNVWKKFWFKVFNPELNDGVLL